MDEMKIKEKYFRTITLQKYLHILLGISIGAGVFESFFSFILTVAIFVYLMNTEKKITEPIEKAIEINSMYIDDDFEDVA